MELLDQYRGPLMNTYLQSRGSDEEREKWGPWCGFEEGKMKNGVELKSQTEQTRSTREGSTPVHQGSKLKREE